MSGWALLAGYGADLALGDPARWHPVAGFGRLAAAVERRAYAPSRGRGVAVTAPLVALPAAACALLVRAAGGRGRGGRVLLAVLTWIALGGRTLRDEARAVARLIECGELPAARERLRSLCGRDAGRLDAEGLSRAVVESLAENTSDAVIGTLAWGALAGPGGLAAYRAANTLDAMFGHRSERYAAFGWAAARLDDAMNWVPARLTAWLTCAMAPLVGGASATAALTLRRDGRRHPSPNAGPVEAAFAGALGVGLGGPLAYGGRPETRPRLGSGNPPAPRDIARAARLSWAVSGAAALLLAGLAAVRDRVAGGSR